MDKHYLNWIQELKQRIHTAQLRASIAVNEEMILLYWDLGQSMVEQQEQFGWGSKVVGQMAKDLKRELPDTNGFSRTNLFAMRKFYLFYRDSSIIHQAGGQLEMEDLKASSEIVHPGVDEYKDV
jgi:predicted nuclease of restriction endonuclease-like (RecB) superfamily